MQRWSQATLYKQTVVLDVVIDEERLKQIVSRYDRYLRDGIAEVQRNDKKTHLVLEANCPKTLEHWALTLEQVERDVQQANHLAWLQNVMAKQADDADMSLYKQLEDLRHRVDCLQNAYRKHMLADGQVPQDTPEEEENPF